MSALSPNVRGALFAIAAFAAFSTHDALIKTLGGRYAAPQVIFFSVLLSFPLLSLMLIRQKTAATLRPRYPSWVGLRSAAVIVTALSVFYAFSTLPLAQVYAILFATPLLITLLSIPILGERVGIHRGLAVLVGLTGVLIVLRPGASELSLGHLAAFAGACASALASVIARKVGGQERNAVLLLYPLLGNVVVMGALLPAVYVPMSLGELGLTAALSGLAFTGMTCILLAYRHGEAAVVAPMQYSQLLWALAFGAVFFGESVDWPTLAGAGVVISSGVYILWREARVSANRPVSQARGRPDTGTAPRLSPDMLPSRAEKSRPDTEPLASSGPSG